MISCLVLAASIIAGAESDQNSASASKKGAEAAVAKPVAYVKPDGELGQSLNEQATVFLDRANKRLWLKTTVAQETGVLEMFLCKRATKEHESVVAVDSPAFVVHAGLLALGLEPGTPARFEPEFSPPSGAELTITVHWFDEDGTARSQQAGDWIRRVSQRWFSIPCTKDAVADVAFPDDLDLRFIADDEELIWFGPLDEKSEERLRGLSQSKEWQTKVGELKRESAITPFEGRWIFAGSRVWNDAESGEKHYEAESGNLICVANFGDAMIDIDIESSAQNASLLFEPWTERVPPRGTPVLVEIGGKN